jgi:adenosylcobyric acid synthase
VESNLKSISGLGLLDMKVTFGKEKTTTQAKGEVIADNGILSGIKGCMVEGYEIHMGENTYGSGVSGCIKAYERNGKKVDVSDGVCNAQGNVFGSYIHGLFDSGAFLRGIINNVRLSKGYTADTSEAISYSEYKTRQYDKLADILRNSLDIEKIYKIMRKEI